MSCVGCQRWFAVPVPGLRVRESCCIWQPAAPRGRFFKKPGYAPRLLQPMVKSALAELRL